MIDIDPALQKQLDRLFTHTEDLADKFETLTNVRTPAQLLEFQASVVRLESFARAALSHRAPIEPVVTSFARFARAACDAIYLEETAVSQAETTGSGPEQ